MIHRLCLALLLVFGLGWPRVASADEVTLRNQKLTLPKGFTVTVAAASPLVDRPITAAFDEQGRLYVSESSGSNDNIQQQLKALPHRILRLIDKDGDGKFDERTIFAEKMMLPEGTMWLDGSLYVSAPPSIWKLTDTNDDGVADKREEWFNGKTLTGCANDLHGPYLGRDGWIYWCKGAFAEQTYQRPGRKPLVTKASHIFRARPDGSGLEPVMTGGMDNPVDVTFTAEGERIFTTTFLQHPGGGKRDGLIHAIYGGVYGKIHNVIDDHPQTGEVMPVLTHLGAAAPSGLMTYESRAFGEAYTGNLFAAQFNMHKISRQTLVPAGATFTTKDEDFLLSDSLDFHPTDVIEDADGSLVVVDTGGWYKLCCPTSQLHKPDVLGAIYRVRRSDAPAAVDPRGLRLGWDKATPEQLAEWLGDARPAVRDRAIATLARMDEKGLAVLSTVLKSSPAIETRRAAVWALARVPSDAALPVLREALADANPSVRQAAIHALSVRRDKEALPQLMKLIAVDLPPAQRRAAAEAIGRIGDPAAVPALLQSAQLPIDRVLEHSLAYALMEINAPQETAFGLKSKNVNTQRIALLALSEMETKTLKPGDVTPLLSSPDPQLRQAALWVYSRNGDWGNELAGYVRQQISAERLTAEEQQKLEQLLTRFAASQAITTVLGEAAGDTKLADERRVMVLSAMSRSGVKEMPAAWNESLTRICKDGPTPLTLPALRAVRAIPLGKRPSQTLISAVRDISDDPQANAALRLLAASIVQEERPVSDNLFALLLKNMRADADVAQRGLAVDVLVQSRLSVEQMRQVARALAHAGPLETGRLLTIFGKATDDSVGQELVATLKSSPQTLASLRADSLQLALAKFSDPVRRDADELYRKLNVDLGEQAKQLETLLATLKAGDVRRGQAVFHSQKAACFACHSMGYLGGKVGPDLTQISRIRSRRDLVEAIVFPSASFVRSYEPVTIVTTDGLTHNGTIRVETDSEIILTTGPNQEVRVPKDKTEAVAPSRVSVMPAGLDKQLSAQELADLITYLQAAK